MTWQNRIVIDPEILTGKPVVKGTRLAVEFIIDLLARDWSEAEILREYPGLTREDIQACREYADHLMATPNSHPDDPAPHLHTSNRFSREDIYFDHD